jgi:hypothetical protein
VGARAKELEARTKEFEVTAGRLTNTYSRLSDDPPAAISQIRNTGEKGPEGDLTIVTGQELARRLVGEVHPGLKRSA